MRTRGDLRRYERASGCRLIHAYEGPEGLVGEWECPDVDEGEPMATATLLELLADDDPRVGAVPRLSGIFRHMGSSRGQRRGPEALHALVKRRARFRPEEGEVFQAPSVTLARGFGDCDDSARLLVVLAREEGYPARLVYFMQGGQPAHVCAQVFLRGAWRWAETSIDARFGEHPFHASDRLGLERPDIDGTPHLLRDGQAVPLRRTMGAMSGSQVTRAATPTDPQTFGNALLAVWPSVVGGQPSTATLVLLTAMSAFETGAWKACWNYNYGNAKWWGGTDYFTMTATEGDANPTMVASKFAAWPSMSAGVTGFLQILMASRYSAAWTAALAGDVAGFVSGLKSGGYFTGNLAQYTAGVQAYVTKYQGLTFDPTLVDDTAGPSSADVFLLLFAAGIGAALGRTGALEHLLRSF